MNARQLHLANDDGTFALEHVLDDAFEGAEEHVSGKAIKELDEFLAAWSLANLPTGYMVDYKTAIVIK